MLAVVKALLPVDKWIAEPKVLNMMQAGGLPNAEKVHFTSFYRKGRGVLDKMLQSTGGRYGHDGIFLNHSAYSGASKVRYYYKLSSPTAQPRYAVRARGWGYG